MLFRSFLDFFLGAALGSVEVDGGASSCESSEPEASSAVGTGADEVGASSGAFTSTGLVCSAMIVAVVD